MEIPVTYFRWAGWFYGITRGHTLKNVFLRMGTISVGTRRGNMLVIGETVCAWENSQSSHAADAKSSGTAGAQHETQAGFGRRADSGCNRGTFGIEGAAASQYFQQFNGMVKNCRRVGYGTQPNKRHKHSRLISTSTIAPGVHPPIQSTRCFLWHTGMFEQGLHAGGFAVGLILTSVLPPARFDGQHWLWIYGRNRPLMPSPPC